MSIVEKIPIIYDNVPEVYSAGKMSDYDEFWDTFQVNGTRGDYTNAFLYWNHNMLKPKYDIIVQGSMASAFREVKGIRSLPEFQNEHGITVDLSGATDCSSAFFKSDFEEFGEIDLSKSDAYNFCFSTSKVKSISKLKLKATPGYNSPYGGMFANCTDLETLIVEGGINKSGFSVSAAPNLSHDSLLSIINCLGDKSTDTSSTTWKVTFGSTNLAKLTSSELQEIETKGWTYA